LPKSLPKRIRFTDLAISRLKEPGIAWDVLLPRFGVRVSPRSKVWLVTVGASKRRFGRFPELSVADARAKARQLLTDSSAGNQGRLGGGPLRRPGVARQQATDDSGADTFGELAAAFLSHGRTKRGRVLRPATLKEYRLALLTYANALQAKPVREIGRRDVAAVITSVAQKSGTTSAMRCRATMSRFLGWCVAQGHIEANPATGTEGYSVERRSRVLRDGELAALWGATDAPGDFNLILRLCLWSGCRRSEAGSMCWSQLSDGVWTVPGSRTKNHRTLMLPLPSQALAALAQWPRVLGKDTLFGRGPNGFQAWSKSKERLDRRLGFREPWDLHDLRRSVQTRMIKLGVGRDIVNRTLNHAMGPIDEAYDQHNYAVEKASALQRWADQLDAIVKTPAADAVRMQVVR
jgi:integrase